MIKISNQPNKKDEEAVIATIALIELINQSFPSINVQINDGLTKQYKISHQTIAKYKRRNKIDNYKKLYSQEDIEYLISFLNLLVSKARKRVS